MYNFESITFDFEETETDTFVKYEPEVSVSALPEVPGVGPRVRPDVLGVDSRFDIV